MGCGHGRTRHSRSPAGAAHKRAHTPLTRGLPTARPPKREQHHTSPAQAHNTQALSATRRRATHAAANTCCRRGAPRTAFPTQAAVKTCRPPSGAADQEERSMQGGHRKRVPTRSQHAVQARNHTNQQRPLGGHGTAAHDASGWTCITHRPAG
jgi:hypothetical protein